MKGFGAAWNIVQKKARIIMFAFEYFELIDRAETLRRGTKQLVQPNSEGALF